MCYIYIYHSEHYGLSFLDLTDAFFIRSPFLYTFPFCKYTLHVCSVFNVNLTDSFDDDTVSMPFDLMIVLHPHTLIPRISN